MFDTLLAMDMSSAHDTVTNLVAQGRAGGGGGWGNSGVKPIDNLVTTLLQVLGAVVGIGFFVRAAMVGGGKGNPNEKGREAGTNIFWGVLLAVLFFAIPMLFTESKGILGYIF